MLSNLWGIRLVLEFMLFVVNDHYLGIFTDTSNIDYCTASGTLTHDRLIIFNSNMAGKIYLAAL